MTRRKLFEAPKHMRLHGSVIVIALTLTLFTAGIFAAPPAQDKKLTLEELIARHIESIGSPEARAAARSRVVKGSITLAFRVGGAGSGTGSGTLASIGSKVWYGMKFNCNRIYRRESGFRRQACCHRFSATGRAFPTQHSPQHTGRAAQGRIAGRRALDRMAFATHRGAKPEAGISRTEEDRRARNARTQLPPAQRRLRFKDHSLLRCGDISAYTHALQLEDRGENWNP